MPNADQPVPIKTASPKWYELILILLGFTYLAFELSFNTYLVDTATLSLTGAEVEHLETFGRTLSGFGLMLLIFGWIKYNANNKFQTFLKLAVYGLAGFMLMFAGQKALIDYLVDQSSAQQRKDSQYIILMKQAMVKNAIHIEGVEYSQEEIQSPQVKTFLNTVGLLSFLNPDFINVIKDSSRDIVKALLDINPSADITKAYQTFDEQRKGIYDSWDKYLDASKKLQQATSKDALIAKAEDAWLDVEIGIQRKWQDIVLAKKKYNDFVNNKAGVTPNSANNRAFIKKSENARIYMEDFFESYRLCHEKAYKVSKTKKYQDKFREKCLKNTLDIYDEKIRKYAGQYINNKEFCTTHPDSRKSLNWEEPFTPKKILNCPGDQDFIINKVITLKQKNIDPRAMFFKQTGFMPEVVYEEFLQSEKVAKGARESIMAKGIQLDESWTPFNDDIFKNKVVVKVRQEAKQQFKQKTKELSGIEIEPYLSFDQFVSLDLIQNKLKKALKTDKKVDVKMSEQEFYEFTIAPEIERILNEAYEPFDQDQSLLANGAKDEALGKQYIKSVIIPPIAMLFSLFFAVLNMVFLTMRVMYLIVTVPKVMQLVLSFALFAAIIILPLQIKNGLGSNSIANYFVKSASKEIGNTSLGIRWLMNFQPIVYPVGKILEDRFK